MLAMVATPAAADPARPVAERVQVFLEDGKLVRRAIRVVDPAPELGRDFLWEPEAGVVATDAEGFVHGRGRLTWRLKGAADYDRAAVHETYAGMMRAGKPDGDGIMTRRNGERLEGSFVAGRLEGSGTQRFANGDRYDGSFHAGLAEGEGRLARRDGSIHRGAFKAGRPHGPGTRRGADGSSYESVWVDGVETGPRRGELAAAGNVGGVVRAQQASGGDAARMEIGFVIDERLNGEAAMQYQHLVRDDDVAIYPVEQEINDSWAASRTIVDSTWPFDMTDWSDAPAYVEMGLATTDGGKVKIDSLELQVSSSETVLKPFLALQSHRGCVGFRPTFNFLNYGWGEVRDATLSVAFTSEDGEASTREYSLPIGGFGDGLDVSLRDALAEAGVDVAALDSKRFPCPSADDLPACRDQVLKEVGFGEVAKTVWGDDRLSTTAKGKINYSWTDANGQSWDQSEPFSVDIALARIEYPNELAECGDGFPGSPEALRYQDVDLPLDRKDYSIPVTLRGNKTLKDYTARLKMHAEKTSFHSMRGVAKFADGSVLQSKPMSFYFFRPRQPDFVTKTTPAACYLPPDDGAC